jgi:ABC-2 type transport system permease protein
LCPERLELRLELLSDALAIASNEFRQFRRNRTAILISLVVLPLFFTFSLGAGSGGATSHFSPTATIPIAFVDNDYSIASSRLLQSLRSSGDFNNLILGYDESNAVPNLGTGKFYAVIVVPQGFQNNLDNNQTTNIILHTDDGEPGVSDQIAATLSSDVSNFDPNVEVQSVTSGGGRGGGLAQIQTGGIAQVQVIQKGAIFSGFNIGLVIVLGVVQIFATFYEIAGGMSKEREDGTLARLLASPASLPAIMLGKTLFDSVLATIRTFIVLGLGVFLYGANPNTDVGTLLVISLLIALLTMGFGFVVSSLRVGQRAVVIIEFFLILFLFAFSGLIIDKELLRGLSQNVSSVLPWAYGFDILRRTVLVGRPLLTLTGDLQFLLGATTLFYIVSYIIFALSRERVAF